MSFRLFVNGLLVSTLVLPAAASNLFPLETGNTWQLRNSSFQYTFTVDEVIRSSGRKLARVRFANPWAEHSWLLLDDAAGVWLAGYAWNGSEFYFDEPSPLFPEGGRNGQVWTGAGTRVRQLASGLAITTPAGVIRNAVEFEVEYTGGSKQRWVVAPGIGLTAGGEAGWPLLLQSYRVQPPSAGTTTTSSCPKVGIASIPANPALNSTAREAALAPVTSIGGSFLSVSVDWNELEPQPYQYASSRVRDELRLAAKYRLTTVLSIRPVDNVRLSRPADLAARSWDDPVVQARFGAALDHLLTGLPPEVRWINIGYEVDPYFLSRPQEIAPYLRFFQAAKSRIKSRISLPVGMVFSFDVTRGNSYVFRAFESQCDHVSFNYYALKSASTFAHRSTAAPAFDALVMRSLARGRQILITETGYSSNPAVGGGVTAQAAFLSNLFSSLRGAPGVAGISVWALNEMPDTEVRQALLAYGIEPIPGSVEFISGLGLLTRGGTTKPAYSTVSAEMTRSATCALP